MKSFAAIAFTSLAINISCLAAGDQLAAADTNLPAPVQVDVKSILNARVVATFSDGQVVPLKIDIDGAGGVATTAAASALGSTNPHTVPDDGHFPANADHPDVVLNFTNADGTSDQVRRSAHEDDYFFDVPPKNYSRMMLFFTSGAAGPAALRIVLNYQDGTAEERNIVCPDWWTNLDGTNKDCFYLASNLAKWGKSNKTLEKDHHNIFGLDVHPTPTKVLTRIEVQKTNRIVVFWGATGQPAN